MEAGFLLHVLMGRRFSYLKARVSWAGHEVILAWNRRHIDYEVSS